MYAPRPLDTDLPDPSSLLVELDRSEETLVHRITIAGELDTISATDLQKTVIDVLRRERPRHVEINLRGVTFLDSAGLRALVSCHSDAQQLDCRLTVTDPHPTAYRVLQITGLLDHFGVTGTSTTRES
jgi:anti-sigma B factor antagonist